MTAIDRLREALEPGQLRELLDRRATPTAPRSSDERLARRG